MLKSLAIFWAFWMGRSLPVDLRGQQAQQWCWAASGEMVMDFLDPDLDRGLYSQSRQASHAKCRHCESLECTPSGPSVQEPCDAVGYPDFEYYGFEPAVGATSIAWNELESEIACGRPVVAEWRWRGGGSHMGVAVGQGKIFGEGFVRVADPLPVCFGDRRHESWTYFTEGPNWPTQRTVRDRLVAASTHLCQVGDTTRCNCTVRSTAASGPLLYGQSAIALAKRLVDWARTTGQEQDAALEDLAVSRNETVSLGPEKKLYVVTAETLRKGLPGLDQVLSEAAERVVVVVQVGDSWRSLITLENLVGGWHISAFGDHHLAQAASANGGRADGSPFVWAPALNMFFVRSADSLSPVFPAPQLDLKEGHTRSWSFLGSQLKALAATDPLGPR